MPQKSSSAPPPVMTWPKAAPILVLAALFDLARLFFNMFWFFGPALAAMYCTSKVSGAVGSLGGLTATLCTAVAAAAGTTLMAATISLGVIMASAAALAGFLTLTFAILVTNARIVKTVRTAFLRLSASFGIGTIPLIGAIPTFTPTIWSLYRRQIKLEKAAYAKWEKENADAEQQARNQRTAQLMQFRTAQQTQAAQQEAMNDEMYTQDEAANDARSNEITINDKIPERGRKAA